MNAKLSGLSRKYEVALGDHLKGIGSSAGKAAHLGTEAVSLGLETLDLAKIHAQASIAAMIKVSGPRDGLVKRAKSFFMEAVTPIERTHLAAATAELHWNKVSEILKERTDELAVSKRDVELHIIQRKASEEALKRKRTRYCKLLQESQSLQKSLRSMVRRLLTAQESERLQISRGLHDEIAQILLAINIRLQALEEQTARDGKKMVEDISSTKGLVRESVVIMRRLARGFSTPHEK
jgi:signal transduction histidine kinase